MWSMYIESFGTLWLIVSLYFLQAVFIGFCYKQNKCLWLFGPASPIVVLIQSIIFLYSGFYWNDDGFISSSFSFIHNTAGVLLVIGYYLCIGQIVSEGSYFTYLYNKKKFGGEVTIYRGSLIHSFVCFFKKHRWYRDNYLSGNNDVCYRCFRCEKQINTDYKAIDNVARYFDIQD